MTVIGNLNQYTYLSNYVTMPDDTIKNFKIVLIDEEWHLLGDAITEEELMITTLEHIEE